MQIHAGRSLPRPQDTASPTCHNSWRSSTLSPSQPCVHRRPDTPAVSGQTLKVIGKPTSPRGPSCPNTKPPNILNRPHPQHESSESTSIPGVPCKHRLVSMEGPSVTRAVWGPPSPDLGVQPNLAFHLGHCPFCPTPLASPTPPACSPTAGARAFLTLMTTHCTEPLIAHRRLSGTLCEGDSRPSVASATSCHSGYVLAQAPAH